MKGVNNLPQTFLWIQLLFIAIMGFYFISLMKRQQGTKVVVERDSKKEMDKLQKLRDIKLTIPLSELTRPSSFADIIGQENGIKALKAALCSSNPQHVIIYGPPGIGKTAAARLVLEVAKKTPKTPFRQDAKFIEMDATTIRFDERCIADLLIGSVHDPIYQGAGSMGTAGIPQPKPGAVTKAHGGVLFIDEIGELHPIQMNKLLKVLEDRKVLLESAYYNSEDSNIPFHIHDIFQNGLPADFRLIAATTRGPDSIPPALRSRCLEIYFKSLTSDEIKTVCKKTMEKIFFDMEEEVPNIIARYATNAREAVNILQTAIGINISEGRDKVLIKDIEWVLNSGQYSPRPEKKISGKPQIGYVNGLAVYGPNSGAVLEIEATAISAPNGLGRIIVTGIIDEEELGSNQSRTIRRKSMAKSSVENVLTVIKKYLEVNPYDYDIHLNFPGGTPIDGPSAGISIAVAIYSAIVETPVDNSLAITGEVSIRGKVMEVGGIVAKIEAAKMAGADKVIIPKDNYQHIFNDIGIEVIPVENVQEVIDIALLDFKGRKKHISAMPDVGGYIAVKSITANNQNLNSAH